MSGNEMREKLWYGVALGIFLGLGLYPLLGVDPNAGYDWRRFFHPQIQNPFSVRVLNPLWIYVPLYPLGWLSSEFSYLVFSVFSFVLVVFALRTTGASRYAFLFSAPLIDLLFLGNLDIFPMFGVVLGWYAIEHEKTHLLGLAFVLLLVKPQIGLPLVVLYFWWHRNLRVIIVPAVVVLVSQLAFGWDWPILWVKTLMDGTQRVAMSMTITAFPYGLLAWFILLMPMSRQDRVIAVLAATFLSVPFAALYSLVSLLILPLPLWAYFLFSLDLFLIGPRFVNTTDRHFWAPRLALVGVLLWVVWRNRGRIIPRKNEERQSCQVAS